MSEPSPEHRKMLPTKTPGVFAKGNRHVVVWRHRGRQRKRSFRTYTEAKNFKATTATGSTAPTSRQSFIGYASGWLATYTGRTSGGLAPSTRASYEDAVDRVIVPYFRQRQPSLKLDELSPGDLREFIAHLAGQGYAPSTVRRHYAPLRAMLADAYESDLLARNPAGGVRVIVPGERARKPKHLRAEQTRALLAAMPAEYADLTYLLAATGLRISEALSLLWRDLERDELGRPVVVIHKSKTTAGERRVPLTAGTMRRLVKRRAEAHYSGSDEPIFATATGTSMDAHNFRQRVFRPAAKRAGVEWATPHKLRHGVASLMAEGGYSPAQIAAHLGHADGGVLALRTYIHADPVDTPDFLDDAFGGTR